MAPSLAPPPSPEVAQQADPAMAQSVFAQQGLDQQQGGQDAIGMVKAKVEELNTWASDMRTLVNAVDPSLMPYLEQIGKVAVEMITAFQAKAERSGMTRGSPVVQQGPPQNPGAPPPNPNGF